MDCRLGVAALFALGFLASLKKKKTDAGEWPVFAKQLLSEREQVLFGHADRRNTAVLQAAGIPIFRVNGGVLLSEEELARMLTASATAAQSMRPLTRSSC